VQSAELSVSAVFTRGTLPFFHKFSTTAVENYSHAQRVFASLHHHAVPEVQACDSAENNEAALAGGCFLRLA
jgi:hypothetical protein